MIEVKTDKGVHIYDSVKIVQSLEHRVDIVLIKTAAALTSDIILTSDGGEFKLQMVEIVKKGSEVKEYKYYPYNYRKFNQKYYGPFIGNATPEELAKNLGIDIVFMSKGISTFWQIPKCRFSHLIDILDSQSATNGAGISYIMGMDGRIYQFDMKYMWGFKNSAPLTGNVQVGQVDESWFNRYPGEFDYVFYTPDGIETENIKFIENALVSKGNRYTYCADSKLKNVIIQIDKNIFWRAMFLSQKYSIDDIMPGIVLNVGTKVLLAGAGEYLVHTTETEVNPQGHFKISYILCKSSINVDQS